MNESLKNKLSEIVGANNISYILSDNKDFSVTGYKVMQNQSSSGLLRCAKIMYNGKIKLSYIIGDYKPLAYVATRLGVNELNAVVFNLIQRAMDIKANGFFQAQNLELDFNKIFVDVSDYTVHLIYFPVSGGMTGKVSGFENEFRVALINLFNSFPVFNAPQFQRLCSDLANGSLPLEAILKKLQESINSNSYREKNYDSAGVNYGGSYGVAHNPVPPVPPIPPVNPIPPMPPVPPVNPNPPMPPVPPANPVGPQPVLTVTAINSPVQLVLSVSQPEYLIGKNPNMVNGAVTHNPAISRVHCKITYSSGRYYLTDVGSANGTYLNQQKLEANQAKELHNGDYIKLANSDFIISF